MLNKLKYVFVFLGALLLFVSPAGLRADTVGQTVSFYIDPQYDHQGRASASAVLVKVSERAYFYVEQTFYSRLSPAGMSIVSSNIDRLAEEFDNRIYPIETNFWGSEYNPGVDGDPRIVIFLTPLVSTAGGYFDAKNENLRSSVADSNQRELIYLNSKVIEDIEILKTFLAHEFQHVINFYQKEVLHNKAEDVWLNEIRSEYSISMLGYNDVFNGSVLQRRLQSFLDNSRDSLTEWKGVSADYGVVNIFGEYLVERYGPNILAESLKSGSTGIDSLDAHLQKNYGLTFKEAFRNWTIAAIINSTTQDSAYGYQRSGLQNFRVQPMVIANSLDDTTNYVRADQIKDWALNSYTIGGLRDGVKPVLDFQFSGEALADTNITAILYGVDGGITVKKYDAADNMYIDGLPTLEKIVLIAIKGRKNAGFGSNEPSSSFSFSFRRIGSVPSEASLPSRDIKPASMSSLLLDYPNGALLRGRSDYKVYVINNGWKRHILNPEVFNSYGFKFSQVVEVESSVIGAYPESKLIRYVNDKKVYELGSDAVKHWLNMTPTVFTNSGRKWEAIFIVNAKEISLYKTGSSLSQ